MSKLVILSYLFRYGRHGFAAIVSLRGKSVGLVSVRARSGKVDMVRQVCTVFAVTVSHDNSKMRRCDAFSRNIIGYP